MPGDADPEAQLRARPADDLAKDLPGLPLKLGKVRVDEDGFHREARRSEAAVDVRWDEVTAVRRDGNTVRVDGRRSDGRAGRLLHLSDRRKRCAAVGEAWREYVLRKIERDGLLAGTVSVGPSRKDVRKVMAGSLVALVAVPFLFYWILPASLITFFGGSFALVCLYGVLLCLRDLRGLSALERWSRWELGQEGLRHWPDGRERRVRSEELALSDMRLDGEPLRYRALSGWPVTAALILAMCERAGGRPWRVGRAMWVSAKALLSAAPFLFVAYLAYEAGGAGEGPVAVAFLSGALVIYLVYVAARERRRVRALVRNGRAMLERLRW